MVACVGFSIIGRMFRVYLNGDSRRCIVTFSSLSNFKPLTRLINEAVAPVVLSIV
jgi:hypothetical protein